MPESKLEKAGIKYQPYSHEENANTHGRYGGFHLSGKPEHKAYADSDKRDAKQGKGQDEIHDIKSYYLKVK